MSSSRTAMPTSPTSPTSKIAHIVALEKSDTESSRGVCAKNDTDTSAPTTYPETPLQAIRNQPRVFLCCLYAIFVLVLSSFDNQAGGTVLSIPEFRKDFGRLYEGSYVLPAAWQSAYSGAPVLSSIVGSIGAGYLADKIGRKWTMGFGYAFVFIAITIETLATTNAIFFAGKLIAGFAIGSFTTTAITYTAEIAPLPLRGILTAASGMAFTFGPFVVSLIVKGTGASDDRWAYRSIFLSQYVFAIIGVLLLPFIPESPWWLLSKNHRTTACLSLSKLGYTESQIQSQIHTLHTSLETSRKETQGATYAECFRGTNLRRTMISVAPLAIQALSGLFFVSAYATYYQQLAGYATSTTFTLSILSQLLSMLGNCISWSLIDRVGRRDLSFWGMVFLTALLLITGALACVGTHPAITGTVAMLLLYNFAYNVTIGATAYPILSETPTARLRAKTASLALSLQSGLYAMWAFVIPYLFNPDKANLGAKVTFIFGALAVLCTVYLWFCQPETKGRTFGELDVMFKDHISARGFKSYKTNGEIELGRVGTRTGDGMGSRDGIRDWDGTSDRLRSRDGITHDTRDAVGSSDGITNANPTSMIGMETR